MITLSKTLKVAQTHKFSLFLNIDTNIRNSQKYIQNISEQRIKLFINIFNSQIIDPKNELIFLSYICLTVDNIRP